MEDRGGEMSSLNIIVGGGLIGLSIAWQMARKGMRVTVLEREIAGKKASWAGSGMLTPYSEAGFEDDDLFRMGEKSLHLYPRFLAELKVDLGAEIPMDSHGSLIVAKDRDDMEYLQRIHEFKVHKGFPVKWISGEEARDLEPLLSPRISSAIYLEKECQVNNRLLIEALKKALRLKGGELLEKSAVTEVIAEEGKVLGVALGNGEFLEASKVIIAAGAWSGKIKVPLAVQKPMIRPVKGQILTLKMEEGRELHHVVRSPRVYLVPKLDGTLRVGASSEDLGMDERVTAGPVMDLLRDAWELFPSIYECSIEDISVGLRPSTDDHLPCEGGCGVEGLYYATGHGRGGILLAPLTAYKMAERN
ncbi:MAG: glycine oxidase [Halioglobus sp.]|jgi:glycine oxidase